MKWRKNNPRTLSKKDAKDNDAEKVEPDLFFLVFYSIQNQPCRIINDIFRR